MLKSSGRSVDSHCNDERSNGHKSVFMKYSGLTKGALAPFVFSNSLRNFRLLFDIGLFLCYNLYIKQKGGHCFG